MSLRKALWRDGAFLGLGQAAAALGGLLGLKILTTVASKETWGNAALLLGLATLGKGFFNPFLQAGLRFFPEARDASRITGLRRVLVRVLAVCIGIMSVGLLVGGWAWTRFGPGGLPFVGFAAVALYMCVEAAEALEVNFLNASGRQGTFSAWLATSAWARPTIAVLLLLLVSPTSPSVVFGYVAGFSVTLALYYRWRIPGEADDTPDPAWDAETRRGILRYGLPLTTLALVAWVMNMGDRYILRVWTDAAEVGVYAAAYSAGSQPFIMLGAILQNLFRPRFFDAMASGDAALERKIFLVFAGVTAACSLAGALLIWLVADWMAALLLGADFAASAATLIPILAAAFATQTFQQTFETKIHGSKRTSRMVAMQVPASAVALVLYFVLIPEMGARGAALGTLVSMLVSCGLGIRLSGALSYLRPVERQ